MTILNPKPIIDKLEKDGVETVKVKRGKGLYRAEKLKLVNEWLAEKAGAIIRKGSPDEDLEPTDKQLSERAFEKEVKTLELANKTDEEYEAADAKTKRAITMARKKLAAEKE
ncbi:MAG: hypothetical protein JRI94_00165 [Deltaproteobacteria bacterium]|nr:hypothetical protein [Deltaproteobacteria bacterium]MBW2031996.1 hypothetical protein [Deltaproteobacteria bacterium]